MLSWILIPAWVSGLSEGKVKKMRQERGNQMEQDIRAMVRTNQDLNTVVTDDGVTLVGLQYMSVLFLPAPLSLHVCVCVCVCVYVLSLIHI